MKRFIRVCLAGVLLSSLSTADVAVAQSVVKVGVSQRDLGAMDPAFGIGNRDEFPIRQVFNVLVGPKDGTSNLLLDQLQGELAETWEMAPDARSFTFRLRKGVQWHRGYGEVTSDDVAFTIARMRDPKTGSAYGSNYREVESVEVPDRYTITIRLTKPNPFFYAFALMPRFGGYIQPRKAVEEPGAKFRHNPVGSGGFTFASYEPKQKVVLRANESYRDGKPEIDTLEVLFLPETASRTIGFVKGDFDMIEGATVPGWHPSLKRQKPDTVFDVGRSGGTWAFHLNMIRKPLDGSRVRKAIAHAIDQSARAAAYGDFVRPIYGLSPVSFYGSMDKDDWPYVYNPRASRKLLAEAGLPNGFSIDMFVTEREEYKSNVLIIQEQLRKVGIQINMRVVGTRVTTTTFAAI